MDYRLPGTNGDLVAQSIDPKIPKYLITGESDPITTYKFIKIFKKPYKRNDIFELFSQYSALKVA